MLEIIALIFGSIYINKLAIQKNESPKKWIFIFIGGWLLAEFIGAAVGLMFFRALIPAMIIGMGCAVSVFFLIKQYLLAITTIVKKYDINDHKND